MGVVPSGDLAYDSSTGEIFVGTYLGIGNASSVRVLSDSNNTFLATIQLGGTPAGMAFDPSNGNLYVNYLQYVGTIASLGWVSVVSDKSNSVVGTIQVGDDSDLPHDNVAYDSGRGEIYVSNLDGTVSIISDENNTVVQTISPYFGCCGSGGQSYSAELGAIAYDSAKGELFVTHPYSNFVSVISDSTNKNDVGITVAAGPSAIAYDFGKGEIFVASRGYTSLPAPSGSHAQIDVISDSTNSIVANLTGNAVNSLVYDSAKNEVFATGLGTNNVTQVFAISDSTNRVVGNVTLANNPRALVYDSGRGEIFASSGSTEGVYVISDSSEATSTSASSSSTSSTTSRASITTSSSTFIGSSSSSSTPITVTSSSSSASGGMGATALYGIAAVVVILIVVAAGYFFGRGRKHPSAASNRPSVQRDLTLPDASSWAFICQESVPR